MNFNTTISVLLLAVAAGVYYFAFESDPLANDSGDTTSQNLVFTPRELPSASVEKVTIHSPNQPPAVFKHTTEGPAPDNWNQSQPVQFPVNPGSIFAIIHKTSQLKYSRKMPLASSDQSLETLGLSPPKYQLTFEGQFKEKILGTQMNPALWGAVVIIFILATCLWIYAQYLAKSSTLQKRTKLLALLLIPAGTIYLFVLLVIQASIKSDSETGQAENQTQTTIALGASIGAGKSYLQIGSGSKATLYVVNSDLHEYLQRRRITDYRPRLLPPIEPGRARRVKVTTPDSTTLVTRSGPDAQWQITKPQIDRANKSVVETLINASTSMRIGKFIEDSPSDLAKYGLDKPALILEIDHLAGSDKKDEEAPQSNLKTFSLHLSDKTQDGMRFALFNSKPPVVALQDNRIQLLKLSTDDLRAPSLTTIPDHRTRFIRKLDINIKGQPSISLSKKGTNWTFNSESQEFKPDKTQINSVLQAITKTHAQSFLTTSSSSLGQPFGRIELSNVETESPELLLLHNHKSDPNLVVVLREKETVGRVVTRDALKPALAPIIAYQDKSILPFRAFEIRRLSIKRTGKYPAAYDIKQIKLPSGRRDWLTAGFNKTKVFNVLRELDQLRATEWSQKNLDTRTPLANLTIKTDKKTYELQVSLDGNLARLKSAPNATFLIPPTLSKALAVELHDTTVLPINADQIKSVTTGAIKFTNRGGLLTIVGSAAKLDIQAAKKLVQSLEFLQGVYLVPASMVNSLSPVNTISVQTNANKIYKLRLFRKSDNTWIGQIDRLTFTLDSDIATTLAKIPTSN